MSRSVRLLAVLAVLAAVGVPTLVASAAPTSAADASRQANSWITRLVRWVQPYNAISRDGTALLDEVDAGIDRVGEFLRRGDAAGAKAWAGPWAAQQRSALVRLKSRLAGPREPQPGLVGPDYDVRTFPNALEAQATFAKAPSLTTEWIVLVERLATRGIDLIEKAASGDPAAVRELAAFYFDMRQATLETEIQQNELFLPFLALSGSPQEQVFRTANASGRAKLALLEASRAEFHRTAFDRVRVAAAVRDQAVIVDRAAVDLRRRAATIRASDLSGELGEKYRRIAASLDQSHVVMVDMAGRLRSIAEAVERGDAVDSPAINSAMEGLSSGVEAMLRQDLERTAILAG